MSIFFLHIIPACSFFSDLYLELEFEPNIGCDGISNWISSLLKIFKFLKAKRKTNEFMIDSSF